MNRFEEINEIHRNGTINLCTSTWTSWLMQRESPILPDYIISFQPVAMSQKDSAWVNKTLDFNSCSLLPKASVINDFIVYVYECYSTQFLKMSRRLEASAMTMSLHSASPVTDREEIKRPFKCFGEWPWPARDATEQHRSWTRQRLRHTFL